MVQKQNLYEFKGSLSHMAFVSTKSLGRRFNYKSEDSVYNFLDPFFLDREKIRLSKSYRRLTDKTQVFPPDLHANVRNRLIHTDDVVNLSSVCSHITGLNIYLTESISSGHDIGHTPFGHLGERLICDMSEKKFSHNVMSVVVAQKVERKGLGLDLTYESLEGILNHSRGAGEMKANSNVTEEATLVMYADKIAYTLSDLNDAIRVGYLTENGLPKIVKSFGKNQRERIAYITFEFLKESSEEGRISFSKSEASRKFSELRSWMYENVYFTLDTESYRQKIYNDLKSVISFIVDKFDGQVNPYFAVSCMTDSEVRKLAACLNDGGVKDLNYGFMEIITNFIGKEIDIFSPDLNKKDFSFKK